MSIITEGTVNISSELVYSWGRIIASIKIGKINDQEGDNVDKVPFIVDFAHASKEKVVGGEACFYVTYTVSGRFTEGGYPPSVNQVLRLGNIDY